MHIQAGDRLIDGAFDTRRPGFVAASHGTLRLCHDTECACRCRKHLPPGIGREGSFSSGVPSIDPASDACSLLTYCLVAQSSQHAGCSRHCNWHTLPADWRMSTALKGGVASALVSGRITAETTPMDLMESQHSRVNLYRANSLAAALTVAD